MAGAGSQTGAQGEVWQRKCRASRPSATVLWPGGGVAFSAEAAHVGECHVGVTWMSRERASRAYHVCDPGVTPHGVRFLAADAQFQMRCTVAGGAAVTRWVVCGCGEWWCKRGTGDLTYVYNRRVLYIVVMCTHTHTNTQFLPHCIDVSPATPTHHTRSPRSADSSTKPKPKPAPETERAHAHAHARTRTATDVGVTRTCWTLLPYTPIYRSYTTDREEQDRSQHTLTPIFTCFCIHFHFPQRRSLHFQQTYSSAFVILTA